MPGCGRAPLVVSALSLKRPRPFRRKASWRSGYAEDCKSLHPGSIPGEASNRLLKRRFPCAFSPIDSARHRRRSSRRLSGLMAAEPIPLPEVLPADFRVVPGGGGLPGKGLKAQKSPIGAAGGALFVQRVVERDWTASGATRSEKVRDDTATTTVRPITASHNQKSRGGFFGLLMKRGRPSHAPVPAAGPRISPPQPGLGAFRPGGRCR